MPPSFLGIGTRKIAVDWHALNFAPAGKPGSITLELTRNQVRLAPEYKRGEPVVVVGAVGAERMPSGEVAAPVAVLDKVVGPDVIAVLRPQPDARSVGQPEPASFGLFMGDLQPLASPDALDPLVVDYPARLAQQPCDLAIAVAAVLLGKLDNIGRQTLLVLTAARDLALRRAMLSERRAGATLGDMQLRSHLLNAGTATRGA